MKIKIIATICPIFFSIMVLAQVTGGPTEMADLMRSNGKIYVVTGVILIIFVGIVLYLIRIDRKMGRLEKEDFLKDNF